jgi:hypothetical protein
MDDVYRNPRYLIRRDFFTPLGAKFWVYDPQQRAILFSQQKAFKLKEDIRVYADESKSREMLTIQARSVIDFSAAYDVVDATEKRKVGALRRKGWSSVVRDSWEFLDEADQPIGKIQEDSTLYAMLRRFVTNLIPQNFHAHRNGTEIATYRQRFNPFLLKLDVEIREGSGVDPRLALAAGILLAAVEGRQQ